MEDRDRRDRRVEPWARIVVPDAAQARDALAALEQRLGRDAAHRHQHLRPDELDQAAGESRGSYELDTTRYSSSNNTLLHGSLTHPKF